MNALKFLFFLLLAGSVCAQQSGPIVSDTYLLQGGTDSCTTYSTIDEFVCDYYVLPSGKDVITSPGTYPPGGTYTDTLTNVNGCDSIITINLRFPTFYLYECEGHLIEWAYPHPHYNQNLILDSEGNFVVHTHGEEFWEVVKYNSEGHQISHFDIPRSGFIDLGPNDDVYVTGELHSGTVDFDMGPDTVALTAINQETFGADGYVTRYTHTGELIWAKSFGGLIDTQPYRIQVDNTGNVYITGWFRGEVDFDPGPGEFILSGPEEFGNGVLFILKLDSEGSFVWAREFAGEGVPRGFSLKVNDAGEVFFCGDFEGTIDFDPDPDEAYLLSSYDEDEKNLFIAKLDPFGNLDWARKLSNPHESTAFALAIDDQNNVYTTGIFHYNMDFDPGPDEYILEAQYARSIYVNKLNDNGEFVWAVRFEGSFGYDCRPFDISLDSENNVYTAGSFSYADFDPGEGEDDLSSVGSGKDGYLSKLDTDGNHVWAHQFSASHVDIKGVVVDEEFNVYGIGNKSGSEVDVITGPMDYYLDDLSFIFKLQPCYKRSSFVEQTACDTMIAPNGEIWTSDGIYSVVTENEDGCDSLITYNLNITRSNDTLQVSACDSYAWNANGETYTSNGLHTELLTNIEGCDSIVTIDLSVGQSSFGFTNITNCEEYLSPSGNYLWEQSGIYADTITNAVGCDSILTIDLTINHETNAAHNVVSCFSYTPPSENTVWTESGMYMDTIPNAIGCDSLMTYNVLIKNIDYSVVQNGQHFTIQSEEDLGVQWVECSNGIEMLNADPSLNFTSYENGQYAAIIEYNGCIDTTQCYPVTGIVAPDLQNAVRLYPNPTTSSVTIDLTFIFDETTVELFNTVGQKLGEQNFKSERLLQLDIPFARGIYYLRISTDTGDNAVLSVAKMN